MRFPGVSGSPLYLCTPLRIRGSYIRMFNNAFTLPSLLPAALLFSASLFLKDYDKEFLEVVHAKQSLLELKYKGVISPGVATAIDTAIEENAKYLLFEHLVKNATVDTLREYCEVAIAADGFPRMQALGRKMMAALPSEGWSVAVKAHGLVHNCLSHCIRST